MRRFAPRNTWDHLAHLSASVEDSRALLALAPLSGPFLPWTSSSMRPAAILAIVSDIVINDHHVILEFGSGNSTVFAARALSHHGIRGHVHSVDHDPAWAALTARAIARESLQPWASVTCAPLVDGWYDKLRLPTVEAIDLLVVDGPPAFERGTETAREPALDVFRERLSRNATIVLDDSWRRGEKRVMAGWQQRH